MTVNYGKLKCIMPDCVKAQKRLETLEREVARLEEEIEHLRMSRKALATELSIAPLAGLRIIGSAFLPEDVLLVHQSIYEKLTADDVLGDHEET